MAQIKPRADPIKDPWGSPEPNLKAAAPLEYVWQQDFVRWV